MKKPIISTKIIILSALCVVLPLFPGKNGKKSDKNNDFDLILKKNALILQQQELQEQKTKTLQLEAEKNRLEQEKLLLATYSFLHEFKSCNPKIRFSQKDLLNQYLTWLLEMKKIFIDEQDFCAQLLLGYGKIFADTEQSKKDFQVAWGEHVCFYPGSKFAITYAIDTEKASPEELILAIRYTSDLNRGSIHFTESDYLFLNYMITYGGAKSQWFANAFLATDKFLQKELATGSYCKKQEKALKPILQKINALNISMKTKDQWHKTLPAMYQIMVNDYQSSNLHCIYDDQKLYEDLNKLHSEWITSNKPSLCKIFDDEITKVETQLKIVPKTSKPIIALNISTPGQLTSTSPVQAKLDVSSKPTSPESSQVKVSSKSKERTHKDSISKMNPFDYTKALNRVTRWWDDLEFIQTQNSELIKRHAFCEAVDYFVDELAIKCVWVSENSQPGSISYNIPGQIIDHDTGKTTTGIFSYGMNKNKALFHRCFSERHYEKIAQDINKQLYDGLFPELKDEESIKKQTKLRSIKSLKEFGGDSIKENYFYVEIKDTDNNMTLRLFKAKR